MAVLATINQANRGAGAFVTSPTVNVASDAAGVLVITPTIRSQDLGTTSLSFRLRLQRLIGDVWTTRAEMSWVGGMTAADPDFSLPSLSTPVERYRGFTMRAELEVVSSMRLGFVVELN